MRVGSNHTEEIRMTPPKITLLDPRLVRMNLHSEAFWKTQKQVMEKGLSDPAVALMAFESARWEMSRPLVSQWSRYEVIVERAVSQNALSLTCFAKKGGSAPKKDELQKVIETLVRQYPELRLSELKVRLSRCEPPIMDVTDHVVSYETEPGSPLKDAPISGLKHRLTRARKFIASQNLT